VNASNKHTCSVSSIDNNNNGGEDYDRPNGRCSFKKMNYITSLLSF
jgi:hypothetical protein